MHAWIENAFVAARASRDRRPVPAPVPDRGESHGRARRRTTRLGIDHDLVDLVAGITIDWKVIGAATLRAAKAGPSDVYRAQAHLYAKGWNDAGYRIEHVAIFYLPRNSVTLDDAVWWSEPFDPDLAALCSLVRTGSPATSRPWPPSATRPGRWISCAAADPRCFDCHRYPDGAGIAKTARLPDVSGTRSCPTDHTTTERSPAMSTSTVEPVRRVRVPAVPLDRQARRHHLHRHVTGSELVAPPQLRARRQDTRPTATRR